MSGWNRLHSALCNVPTETDMIVMDFSKAFDKVPHRRLLYKLEWYEIRGGTVDGTESFPLFCQEYLRVRFWALSFSSSTLTIYLMAPPTVQFADDCILYRHVGDKNDINRLQTDLDMIAKWEETWLMEFNVAKCFTMRVGRQRGRSKMDPPMYTMSLQCII